MRSIMTHTSADSIATSTYRHNRKENTYLFVTQNMKWEDLPEALRQQFSIDAKVIDFDMSPTRKLARSDSQVVWTALTTQGYYLQMPPSDPNALQVLEDAFISKIESGTAA
jgi:uncharacterized protein YcgL (UPF0745 family)